MIATSSTPEEIFLKPLEQQQETVDFLHFKEKTDVASPSLHTDNYFSPLRTLFLSQYKNPLAIATLYSPLVCRDGLFELCQFFYSNPEPSNKNIYLLIKTEFSNFVPTKWRPQVGFYEYRSGKNDISTVDSIYLLLTLSEKTHCSWEFLEAKLNQLKEQLGNQWENKKLFLVPVFAPTSTDNPLQFGEIMAHHSQSVHFLSQACGSNLKAITWNAALKNDLGNSLVVDMNELSLHYGDSYLVQFFLKEGGQTIPSKSLLSQDCTSLSMSFHHRLCMDVTSANFSEKVANEIEAQLKMVLNSRTYQNEIRSFEMQLKNQKELLPKDYAPAFKSLIHQLAERYL